MRILVLEHEPDVPARLLADWAQHRGHELDVVAVPSLERWPAADEYDAVVSLGSEQSVHGSPYGWITREVDFLRQAHASAIPILGICFGGQTLSRALGGVVAAAPQTEVTWRVIESDAPELITPGPWFFWHEDSFTLPPGGCLLAGSDSQTLAFSSGTSLGLQFHPEADADLVREWIAGARAKLRFYGVDEHELELELRRHNPGARARAFDLFDRIAGWWAVQRDRLAGQTGLG
jgi:GMP synthase-like glutamine amidotransferase